MSVVLLPPDFGVHLQTDILEVNISIHLLNVPLGHVVLCVTPVTAAGKCGYFLPEKQTRKYSASKHMNNNQGLHAHVHIVREKMTHDKNVLEEHLWIEFGKGGSYRQD